MNKNTKTKRRKFWIVCEECQGRQGRSDALIEFVMETKAKLGAKAIGRRELENNEGYELKEPQPVGS